MLDKLIFKYDKTKGLLVLFAIFLALSFLVIVPFWSTGFLYSGSDLQFHLSRIQELFLDMKHGSFVPGIATRTFNSAGDMVVASYPWVTLYPFAILMFILKPVSAIYFGMVFYIFITLVISYFSMYVFNKSKKISFYFAILYGFNAFFIFNIFNVELGTFLSYSFFPLAIVGLYEVMFKDFKKWYLLVLGTIGVLYSHAPASMILIYTFIIFYLALFRFQPQNERLKRFIYLCVSGLVTLLLSLIVWAPIINIIIRQTLSKPEPGELFNPSGDLYNMISTTFTSFSSSLFYNGVGVSLLAVVLFGWVYVKHVPTLARYLYVCGLLGLLTISSIFPWYIIHYIPIVKSIESIQTTNRIYPVAIVFLAAFGAYLIHEFYSNPNFKPIYKYVSDALIIITIFFNWFGGVSLLNVNSNLAPDQSGLINQPELNYPATYDHQVPKSNLFGLEGYKVNNAEYNNQFGEENASGMTDFVPIKASNNFGSIGYHNLNYGKNFVSLDSKYIKSTNNSITYSSPVVLKKGTLVSLPFIFYQGVKYSVKVNGQSVNYGKSGDRNTIQFVMPMNAQHAKITVRYLGNLFVNLLSIVSVITWIALIVYLFYFRKKEIKLGNGGWLHGRK